MEQTLNATTLLAVPLAPLVGSALAGLFVWELVKILLTVMLLVASPWVISQLSWLALLAGFVLSMKVSWMVMALGWWRRRTRERI